jgi:hypothetical protein
MLLATSAQAQVWNESYAAYDHQLQHYQAQSAKRALATYLLTQVGVLPEKAMMVANPRYTYESGGITTTYSLRVSRNKVFVGVRVAF